jgi:hypothetical protein
MDVQARKWNLILTEGILLSMMSISMDGLLGLTLREP